MLWPLSCCSKRCPSIQAYNRHQSLTSGHKFTICQCWPCDQMDNCLPAVHATAVAVTRLAAFRDAMQSRSGAWKEALQTWTCPTPPRNSDGTCDPCGRLSDGNWYHMHCRGNSRGKCMTDQYSPDSCAASEVSMNCRVCAGLDLGCGPSISKVRRLECLFCGRHSNTEYL
eukprot:GHUV01039550.1.p1 GENE.GHUV01039550.1~~GHUV01039550.1.p1  ORF type:complete len:170 (-),score=19.76 GHUV01039550.1:430-939(-)